VQKSTYELRAHYSPQPTWGFENWLTFNDENIAWVFFNTHSV